MFRGVEKKKQEVSLQNKGRLHKKRKDENLSCVTNVSNLDTSQM